jgi:hypothetical protein
VASYTMKIEIEVTDSKAEFLLELLRDLPFVRVNKTTARGKEQVLSDLKEAVEEMKLIKEGKKKAQPLKDFLNEL